MLTSVAAEFVALLDEEFEAGKSYKPNEADWFGGRWSGLHKPADPETARRNVNTAIEAQTVRKPGPHADDAFPATSNIHKTLGRVIDAKREMFETGDGLRLGDRRGAGLRQPGDRKAIGVRLSGQDSGRGTFSQRHAMWIDQTERAQIHPAHHAAARQVRGL